MEQPRILNMKISNKVDSHVNENFLAILTGISPIKRASKVQRLFIYEILYKTEKNIRVIKNYKEGGYVLPAELSDISTEFEFQNRECESQTTIFLIDNIHIYLYNFEDQGSNEGSIIIILSL